jgi:hypothetical protein
MIRCKWVDKASRLLAEDGLLKTAMEKGILDIKLVDWPRPRGSDVEDDVDHGWFDNRGEGLIVVHVVLLGETTSDLASLLAGEQPVGVVLVLVYCHTPKFLFWVMNSFKQKKNYDFIVFLKFLRLN